MLSRLNMCVMYEVILKIYEKTICADNLFWMRIWYMMENRLCVAGVCTLCNIAIHSELSNNYLTLNVIRE